MTDLLKLTPLININRLDCNEKMHKYLFKDHCRVGERQTEHNYPLPCDEILHVRF